MPFRFETPRSPTLIGSPASGRPPLSVKPMARLLRYCRPGCLDFRFHSIEIETRAPLHRRKLDGRHRQLFHLLLNKHKAPEFVFEPVEVLLRTVFTPDIGQAGRLKKIKGK